jgi:hypothetical protein
MTQVAVHNHLCRNLNPNLKLKKKYKLLFPKLSRRRNSSKKRRKKFQNLQKINKIRHKSMNFCPWDSLENSASLPSEPHTIIPKGL